MSAFGMPWAACAWEVAARAKIYGGQRLPVRRQVAQVEGDSLGSCGHVLIAVGVGPGRESGPASAVGPAGVGGLGIPETCGDGLGCVMVTGRELEVFLELGGGGEKGVADVLCFHGFGDSPKVVIIPYYREFYSLRIGGVLAQIRGV